MKTVKHILTKGLVAFALVSIGFALGKHATRQTAAPEAPQPAASGRQIAVYYLHSTFRCVTCNTIESMTRELLDSVYSKELADGTIRWIEADFMQDTALARQFEIAASCVVVADMQDGTVRDYKRLDEVWTHMQNPASFNAYVREAIDGYLKQAGGGS